MKLAMKTLLALVVVMATAGGAWAQAAGSWQKVHGQVQAVQGSQLKVKADDGRMIDVDMSQVSQSVQAAMTPNVGVTVTGFPGPAPGRMTARYIEQDNAGPASASVGSTSPDATIARVVPLVPQFVDSPELRDRAAGLQGNRDAAQRFVSQLYRGFFEREPSEQERNDWVSYLLQSRDVRGTVENFLKSPEYAKKGKSEQQIITDLYEAVLGRAPSPDEVRGWQDRIAQR